MGANQSSTIKQEDIKLDVSNQKEEQCKTEGGVWEKGGLFRKARCNREENKPMSEVVKENSILDNENKFKSTINYQTPNSDINAQQDNSVQANDFEINKLEQENSRLEAEIKALEVKSQKVDNAEKQLREQTAGYKRLYVKKIKKSNKSNKYNKKKNKNKSNKKRVNKKKNKSKKKINKRK